MDGGASAATVHGVAKSRTQLSDLAAAAMTIERERLKTGGEEDDRG